MNFREEAERYIAKGFSVIPCNAIKKPAVLTEWTPLQKRQPTEEELSEWAEASPHANIALITGEISDLTVVDADTAEAIEVVEELLPDSLEVPTATTPRGGRHYYFRFTPELRSKAQSGHKNIDVKSEGGYVMAPPSATIASEHSANGTYLAGNIPIDDRPTVPEALLEFLKKGQAGPACGPGLANTAPLTDGRRDEDMFHLAWQLFKDGHSREEVERVVYAAAKAAVPPFPERETRAKIESAWKRLQKNGKADEKSNLRCFASIQKLPIEWLWKGRFPLGMLSLIGGVQGKGKSTFATWMACRLSRGDPWPDDESTGRACGTILITSEDPAEQVIKYRIEAGDGDDNLIFQMDAVLAGDKVFPFDATVHLPQLEADLQAHPEVKLVVIDPMTAHMGGKVDANDLVQVRWSLQGLKHLAQKYNVAIVMIAHFKKDEDVAEVLNLIAGSHQFTSLPRAVWLIMEDKRDPAEAKRRYFAPGKINACQIRGALAFHIDTVLIDGQETGKIIMEAEKPGFITANELNAKNRGMDMTKTEGIKEFITQYLGYGPRLSRDDLDTALKTAGYSPRTADRVKTEMKEAGLIRFKREPGNREGPYWVYLTSNPGRFGE